jgi:hypothetical protein
LSFAVFPDYEFIMVVSLLRPCSKNYNEIFCRIFTTSKFEFMFGSQIQMNISNGTERCMPHERTIKWFSNLIFSTWKTSNHS